MPFLTPIYPTAILSGLRIIILQQKAVRIINFQPRNSHTSPLFKQSSTLKFQDKICLEDISFVSKSLNNLALSVSNTWFGFSSDQHSYETSSSTQGNLTRSFYKTNKYGKYSITVIGHVQNSVHKNWLFLDIYTCIRLRSHNYRKIFVLENIISPLLR